MRRIIMWVQHKLVQYECDHHHHHHHQKHYECTHVRQQLVRVSILLCVWRQIHLNETNFNSVNPPPPTWASRLVSLLPLIVFLFVIALISAFVSHDLFYLLCYRVLRTYFRLSFSVIFPSPNIHLLHHSNESSGTPFV